MTELADLTSFSHEGKETNIGPFSPLPLSWYLSIGMGLAITRTIVGAHGGRLRTENNPDCRATSQFTLPLENATA